MYNGKKNLIPLNKRPKEEALAIRRKGQKAATKARRIKRLFIDTFEKANNIKLTTEQKADLYSVYGKDIVKGLITIEDAVSFGIAFGAAVPGNTRGQNTYIKALEVVNKLKQDGISSDSEWGYL